MGREQDTLRATVIAAMAFIKRTEPEIEKLQKQVDAYRQIIKLWEKATGGAPLPAVPNTRSEQVKSGLRAAPGEVKQRVREVLSRGGDFTAGEIVNAIAEQWGAVYGRATIASMLMRGQREGIYVKKERRWRMKA